MKRRFLTSTLTGLIILAGVIIPTSVQAQSTPDQNQRGIMIDLLDQVPFAGEVNDLESDPAVEERNLRQEFRDIEMTNSQFDQIRQARRQFRADLGEIMTSNLGGLIQLIFLPKAQAEQKSIEIFGAPIRSYGESIARVLSPEQVQVWQRNMEQDAQNRQQQTSR
jgi:Spy/CpxP family protein refolding chaperone